MHPRKTSIPAALLLIATAACDQHPAAAPVAPPPSTAEAALISRGFALALADSGQRATLRDAFRGSPLTEHKLILQDFIATAPGKSLVRAAASEVGVSEAEFTAEIARLPRMDFYVPGREDRMAWQGDDRVAVFAAVERGGPIGGYTPGGTAVLAPASLSGTDVIEIVMHPIEVSSYRLNRQPDAPGRAIQDAQDGEFGIVVNTHDLFGNVISSVDMGRVPTPGVSARLYTAADDAAYCAYGTLEGDCPLKDTWMEGFTANVSDGDGAWGSLEMIFKAYFSVKMGMSGASTKEYHTYTINGVPPSTFIELRHHAGYDPMFGLNVLYNTPVEGGCSWSTGVCKGDEVSISVREDDGSFGQDHYGNATFYGGQSNTYRTTTSGYVSVGVTWMSRGTGNYVP